MKVKANQNQICLWWRMGARLVIELSRIADALEGIETALAGKAKAESKILEPEKIIRDLKANENSFREYVLNEFGIQSENT